MISPERSTELLHTYATTGSGEAFREIMEGWTDMVYATAMRVTRGPEAMAEDITQTVFSRLAAAPELVKNPRVLGSWLHAAATGTALALLRLNARRRRREETSQLLVMHSTEPPSPDHADGGRELKPEIDGALSELPPQDSELLIRRFWQREDWRSIGGHFGLSDDAAQKRMSRALERLRRILARRGITSTAGVLSAVLAGTVPRKISAATVLKIFSATQASTAGIASTILTTAAMTTKTKVTIAATVILVFGAPLAYQQQRIAGLEREVQVLQQRVAGPGSNKTPSLALGAQKDSAHAVPAKMNSSPDSPPTDRFARSGGEAEKGEPADFDSLNRKKLKEKLSVLRKRLLLTPEQEPKIEKALEYGQSKMETLPHGTVVTKAGPADLKKMSQAISAVLTDDQRTEYETFRAEETANAVEAAATRELSSLQSITTLSQEQKDQAFAVLSEIATKEFALFVADPGVAPPTKEETESRWVSRQKALRTILTPEQMVVYQQAGNPFQPVTKRAKRSPN